MVGHRFGPKFSAATYVEQHTLASFFIKLLTDGSGVARRTRLGKQNEYRYSHPRVYGILQHAKLRETDSSVQLALGHSWGPVGAPKPVFYAPPGSQDHPKTQYLRGQRGGRGVHCRRCHFLFSRFTFELFYQ